MKHTQQEIEKAKELKQHGLAIREIARQLGFNPGCLVYHLRKETKTKYFNVDKYYAKNYTI